MDFDAGDSVVEWQPRWFQDMAQPHGESRHTQDDDYDQQDADLSFLTGQAGFNLFQISQLLEFLTQRALQLGRLELSHPFLLSGASFIVLARARTEFEGHCGNQVEMS